MREEPRGSRGRRPWPRWWWVPLVCSAGGAVGLGAGGAGGGAVLGWLACPLLLGPAAVAVLGGAELVRQGWALRARGAVAPARLVRTYALHGEDTGEGCVYVYVDDRGLAREWRGRAGAAEQVEILYDPEDPEVARPGRSTTARLTGTGALALGVGGLLLFLAAMVLAPVVRALRG
ncbi:DUF3592 domain-containing protein [Streptomyces sp. Ru71]|uniref:DUF3592 domain-containing protein n=1 Tax=Streptomyces sp. Ru71 TaxID=2080746 RepID=UPI0011AFD34A|nr:DUF3592 domain-containing protein [Streptomyces sp. Ru71]